MSLDSLLSARDLKFVFVGGKGGVGKTTTSSAVAALLAQQRRVLLVSTDPAHSLGDAWRTTFSGQPTAVVTGRGGGGGGGECQDVDMTSGTLDVMEVDPQESLDNELKHWASVSQELFGGDQGEEWSGKIGQFQEWLSGIPGIDEATALSTAISQIESGRYDVIVFDTAPTGHTLKLLALPEILEKGIDKLQSWQATFWSYWEALKGMGSAKSQKKAQLQQDVTKRLQNYKRDIQKVALMLQDPVRTRFVVVCIAEYLSISETQRLLQELAKNKVVASHVVVNQLVVRSALTSDELGQLESLAELGNLQLPMDLLQKTVHACRLTSARRNIQQRYLDDLKKFPETQGILDGICEVPLLAEEVTGTDAILGFARLLVKDTLEAKTSAASELQETSNQGGKLYDHLLDPPDAGVESPDAHDFVQGDRVQVTGLAKAPQFNHLEGHVTSSKSEETGRYGVKIQFQGKTKTLALLPKNMVLVRHGDKKARPSDSPPLEKAPAVSDGIMNKAMKVLEDPEIKALVEQNPRFKVAVEDCLENPMNVMKYLGDPEMSPLISKAMSKM